MRILLTYHFFYPDEVVSARIFTDLAQKLVSFGHDVTVYTCNRLLRGNVSENLPEEEDWRGIHIRRFSRPPFAQKSNVGRLFNSFILSWKWMRAFRSSVRNFDAVVIGTDPQFSYWIAPWLRIFNRKLVIAHWCFDLYPEAILTDSPPGMRCLAALTKPFAFLSYRYMDVIADLGTLMRAKLLKYRHRATCVTLTPWALVEPAGVPETDPAVRKQLFGNAAVGVLYSGTVGNAHDLGPFIELARECRRQDIPVGFCFAGYGCRYGEQLAQITNEDSNIVTADFIPAGELEKRLAAADLHAVSIAPGWEGVVLPSKIFGALASGRGILYSGNPDGIAGISLEECGLGFILTSDNVRQTAQKLRKLIDHPEELRQMQRRAFDCYRARFAKDIVAAKWDAVLRETFDRKNGRTTGN